MKIPTVQNTLQTVILTPLHFSAIHISLILYHSGDFLLECLKFYIRRAIHSLTTKFLNIWKFPSSYQLFTSASYAAWTLQTVTW